MIQKILDTWNNLKKIIQEKKKRLFFKNGEVWWAYLGKNIGSEQDGKNTTFTRPIVIIKKFNNHLFWAIPLTTQVKNNKYHCKISFGTPEKESYAMISQLRLMDGKRLKNKLGRINSFHAKNLKEKITNLLNER